MANRFLSQIEQEPQKAPAQTFGQSSSNRFLSQIEGIEIPHIESGKKTASRYAYQPIAGALKKLTWPADLVQAWGLAEGMQAIGELDDERIAELKEKFPTAPWENFKAPTPESTQQALAQAANIFPTQGNIERGIEETTGLPLEAKTKGQKLVRLGTTAAGFRPGGIAPKATAGIVAPAVSATAKALGVPESASELLGLGASGVVPSPQIAKQVKPSGLPVRRYEGLKKETQVTPGQAKNIRQNLESDVRKLTDDLIQKESETARQLKGNPNFPQEIDELFGKVEAEAAKSPKQFDTTDLRYALRKKVEGKMTKGISADEYEVAYKKEMAKLTRTIPLDEDATTTKLLEQYRKNNRSFGEIYEQGKSDAANRAKRDALVDYNIAISEQFEKHLPESDFNRLFKFTNEQYRQLQDLDAIEGFFGATFGEKINYKKAQEVFKKDSRTRRAFERTLGKDSMRELEGIFKDFLPTEKAMKLIKEGEALGYKDIAKMAGKWVLSPALAKASAIYSLGKEVRNSLLSSPKFRVTWKSALDAFKNGSFEEAENLFQELNKIEKETKKST